MIGIFILNSGSAQWRHQHLPFVRTDNGTSHPMCAALATLCSLPGHAAMALCACSTQVISTCVYNIPQPGTAATQTLLRCAHHVHVLGQRMLLSSIKSWLPYRRRLPLCNMAARHTLHTAECTPERVQLRPSFKHQLADVMVESSPCFFAGHLLHRSAWMG